MPRFVILEHDHPFLHWDLMLEAGDALRTWRLLQEPKIPGISENLGDLEIEAEALPDHRLAYLDYEGPVSGGRGVVKRRDAGEFTWGETTEERIEVELRGEVLRGRAVLRRSSDGRWTFNTACVFAGNRE